VPPWEGMLVRRRAPVVEEPAAGGDAARGWEGREVVRVALLDSGGKDDEVNERGLDSSCHPWAASTEW
jgi:hypothetical protein